MELDFFKFYVFFFFLSKQIMYLQKMKKNFTKIQTINRSRGFGDTVEKFTKATGIKRVVDTVTKGDCGCNKRRDSLNRMFPYKK